LYGAGKPVRRFYEIKLILGRFFSKIYLGTFQEINDFFNSFIFQKKNNLKK
jgi:hypothetical protein